MAAVLSQTKFPKTGVFEVMRMKYRIEISEEQLRVIGLAVDEYMRLRMGQFDALAEDLTYDGIPRVEACRG